MTIDRLSFVFMRAVAIVALSEEQIEKLARNESFKVELVALIKKYLADKPAVIQDPDAGYPGEL